MKNLNGDQPQLRRVGQAVESTSGDQGQEAMISMLLNAVHYYLDCALILHSTHRFRLVVFHRHNVLLDKRYTTRKGAKIAFHKIYRHQACIEGVEARWDDYVPEGSWIEKKMAILERKKGEQGEEDKMPEVNDGKLPTIFKSF